MHGYTVLVLACAWLHSRNGGVVLVFACVELQALVYDILPSATSIIGYAIGLEKRSAKEQFFDDAQTAVSSSCIPDVSSSL